MVLLVEPDDLIASRLTSSLDGGDEVRRCVGFTEARAQLRLTSPDLLVSNLRLCEYNGLQLVYLDIRATTRTPAIIYTTRLDPTLAEDVQRAGAFYDTADCLAVSLRAYLGAELPPRDRRDPQRRAGRVDGPGRRLRDR
jgi:DNA-binding NtrC family response regulator